MQRRVRSVDGDGRKVNVGEWSPISIDQVCTICHDKRRGRSMGSASDLDIGRLINNAW